MDDWWGGTLEVLPIKLEMSYDACNTTTPSMKTLCNYAIEDVVGVVAYDDGRHVTKKNYKRKNDKINDDPSRTNKKIRKRTKIPKVSTTTTSTKIAC